MTVEDILVSINQASLDTMLPLTTPAPGKPTP